MAEGRVTGLQHDTIGSDSTTGAAEVSGLQATVIGRDTSGQARVSGIQAQVIGSIPETISNLVVEATVGAVLSVPSIYMESFGEDLSGSLGSDLGISEDTKGSYVELIASTSYDYYGVYLNIGQAGSSNFTIDLAVGAGGSEVIIVPDISFIVKSNNFRIGQNIFLPIVIPEGTRIAARAQGSTGSSVTSILGHGLRTNFNVANVFASAFNIGLTVSGGVGTLMPRAGSEGYGAWTELSSSIERDIKGFYIILTTPDAQFMDISHLKIDIGVGSAASEVAIVSNHMGLSNAEADVPYDAYSRLFQVQVPSGTRVSARVWYRGTVTDAMRTNLHLMCVY